MEIGGPSSKSTTDGNSHSAQDIISVPASLPLQEHPAQATNPGVVSLVAALMHDVIASLNHSLVSASEVPIVETIAVTTFGVVATLVAPEPKVGTKAAVVTTTGIIVTFVASKREVEIEAARALEVLASIMPSE